MPPSRFVHRTLSICLITFAAAAIPAVAEQVAPFVVSPERDVEAMMELAEVGPMDYVIDLGAGDGRIVVAAAQRGALAQGVEIDPDLVAQARERAETAGVADRTVFVAGDLFEADFRHATVVTLYLFPEANLRLRPLLLEQLRPGTRVLSNSFDMGDWTADAHVDAATSGGILMWTVPAGIAGRWEVRIGSARWPLRLFQRYQRFHGELGDPPARLGSTRLEGERIRFRATLDGEVHRFTGWIDGESMGGVVHIGDPARVDSWSAVRRAPD